jgi:hypothetical protein
LAIFKNDVVTLCIDEKPAAGVLFFLVSVTNLVVLGVR